MSKASLSPTGPEAYWSSAEVEARMLVERHVRAADAFARQDSITRRSQDALAEALAAFVAE